MRLDTIVVYPWGSHHFQVSSSHMTITETMEFGYKQAVDAGLLRSHWWEIWKSKRPVYRVIED